MRAFMGVIGLYLVVTLALPLYTMLSKSFSTYRFDLTAYAFQVDTGAGWGEERTAAAINAATATVEDRQVTGEARLPAAELFPDFSFRAPTKYRLRIVSPGVSYLFGSERVADSEWREYSSNDFRRVMLRPAADLGLANYARYFGTPALSQSIWNSLFIAAISTLITVSIAFGFAYAMTRSCMRFKGFYRVVVLAPILVPSLLPGIALVYLFGNQGVMKGLLLGHSIYGPIGIVVGSVFFTLPHAYIIIQTALAIADARHYEAAVSLKASPFRIFRTVTLPGAGYGLVSAAFVVFNLVITDFGLPKVIGGSYNVLAVDIYKQVIGQQNFEMGAVVSVMLLVPALVAFAVDRLMQRRQVALITARSVAFEPKPHRRFDALCLLYCAAVAFFILLLLGMCQFAALVKLWPYDLSLSLRNYDFDRMDGGGWSSYWTSIQMSLWTALIGTGIIFLGAYMVEKTKGFAAGRNLFQLLAMMPMAIPGMVLGLAYIFFFNNPANPFHFLYGTLAILVVCTVTHFYTVGHLTALTALKQMDGEFEAVSASLKQPVWRLFAGVTVPVCLPALLDISIYLFVNAMTTVSAVVFLYSAHTTLASVAVLNMDDAGDVAPAAAMGMMIFYTNIAARLLHLALSRGVLARTQAWRMR
ncbi:MAG: putative 2-aminoethylphosphonate ABC transporter permease subunit [Parvibaculaceae bacterium]